MSRSLLLLRRLVRAPVLGVWCPRWVCVCVSVRAHQWMWLWTCSIPSCFDVIYLFPFFDTLCKHIIKLCPIPEPETRTHLQSRPVNTISISHFDDAQNVNKTVMLYSISLMFSLWNFKWECKSCGYVFLLLLNEPWPLSLVLMGLRSNANGRGWRCEMRLRLAWTYVCI